MVCKPRAGIRGASDPLPGNVKPRICVNFTVGIQTNQEYPGLNLVPYSSFSSVQHVEEANDPAKISPNFDRTSKPDPRFSQYKPRQNIT